MADYNPERSKWQSSVTTGDSAVDKKQKTLDCGVATEIEIYR